MLAFLDKLGELTECPVRLAGDAVLIAPVSEQISRKQGILQGISRFQAFARTLVGGKRPLSCGQIRHFP